MPEMRKSETRKIVMACAVLVVFIIVGWLIVPMVMEALGVPSTFTCHCIGGIIGLVAGILFLRNYVY